jgi:hypothetical protein
MGKSPWISWAPRGALCSNLEGTMVTIPNYADNVNQWLAVGEEVGVTYVIILYDPACQDCYPHFVKSPEADVRRVILDEIPYDHTLLEVYFLGPEPSFERLRVRRDS